MLFSAAAATADPDQLRRQLAKALRISALLLLPMVPPAVALAPSIVPALLGPEWRSMVVPLQLLVIVGVAQALANIVGEFLSGTGHIAVRTKITLAWAVAMVVALQILARADVRRGPVTSCVIVAGPAHARRPGSRTRR